MKQSRINTALVLSATPVPAGCPSPREASHRGHHSDCTDRGDHNDRDKSCDRAGMVLFIVAIAMAMVSLAAMGFMGSMRIDHRTARLQADARQVEHVAASAEEYVREWAGASRTSRANYLASTSTATWFRDVRVDFDRVFGRHGRFSLVTAHYSADSPEPRFEFGILPTSAKLSLAAVLKWDLEFPGQGRDALLRLPGMTQESADAMLDWMDADDEPREFGAESEFYLGLFPPRQPPNRVVAQLDELLAVRGVSAWQLFGKEDGIFSIRNPDTQLAGGMELLAEGDGADTTLSQSSGGSSAESWSVPAPPWSYYLTTTSAERNESASGQRRIDLNQQDLRQLRQQLSASFSDEIAAFVIAMRQLGRGTTDWDRASSDALPSTPPRETEQYMFSSPLDLWDAVVDWPRASGSASDNANGGTAATSYRSPFSSRDASQQAEFVRFCDATTVDAADRVADRVNLLNAPRPVLLAIPGMSEEVVDALLAARSQSTREDVNRDDPVWLLTEGIVEADLMRRLSPYLTMGGDVFQTQIIAYYDAQSPWVRHEIMIDGSSPGRPTVYFRDLRRQGRGFRQADLESPPTETQRDTTESVSPFGDAIRAEPPADY